MPLTRDQFEFLFSAMMMRPPTASEVDELLSEPDMSAPKLVARLGQSPEFVMKRPFFAPTPIYDDLVPASANGVDFLVPSHDWVHWGIRHGGGWEPHVAETMRRFLRPGGVFVDVGANIGVHTVLGANLVGTAGKVYAIEASIEVAAILLINARRTKLLNIYVLPRAVADAQRHEHIMVANATTNRIVRHQPVEERIRHKFDPVLTDTLDNMLGHLDHCDLLKIDIEGREGSALRGAAKLLDRTRPVIIAEHHYKPPEGFDETYFVEELIARGYEVAILAPDKGPLSFPSGDALRKYGAARDLVYSDLLFIHRGA